jgi:hypothetical protein
MVARWRFRRPTPVEWLWYAMGGRLRGGLAEWVRHDLTCRAWVARHLGRVAAQCALPAVLLLAFLPGALGLRVGTVLLGVIVAVYYSVSYVEQIRASRLVRHGWPADLGRVEQERRTRAARSATEAAYAATWRTPS